MTITRLVYEMFPRYLRLTGRSQDQAIERRQVIFYNDRPWL